MNAVPEDVTGDTCHAAAPFCHVRNKYLINVLKFHGGVVYCHHRRFLSSEAGFRR